MTTTTEAQLREWQPDDEPAVLELLTRSLGPGPAGQRSAAFFRWKHLANPFGPSLLLVAEADEHVVGLRALMRWRFLHDGRTLRAVRAVDTATDPAHRGRGVFSRLTTLALERLRADTDLVFNTPNDQSLPGYTRLGWELVGRLPIRVRVRHPLHVARDARRLGLSHVPRRPEVRVDAAPASDLLASLDPEALLDARPPSPTHLRTDRSPAVLQWRYAQAPHLDYRAVGDADTGLAIFRVRPRGRLWETTIAEVLPRAGRRGATRELLDRVVHAADTDHVTMHAGADGDLRRVAGARGFVRAPGGVLLVRRAVAAPLPTALARVDTWDLSLGDVEVF